METRDLSFSSLSSWCHFYVSKIVTLVDVRQNGCICHCCECNNGVFLLVLFCLYSFFPLRDIEHWCRQNLQSLLKLWDSFTRRRLKERSANDASHLWNLFSANFDNLIFLSYRCQSFHPKRGLKQTKKKKSPNPPHSHFAQLIRYTFFSPPCDQILAVSCNVENLKEGEAIVTFTYCSTSVIFASVSLHIAAAAFVVFQPSAIGPVPAALHEVLPHSQGCFFG